MDLLQELPSFLVYFLNGKNGWVYLTLGIGYTHLTLSLLRRRRWHSMTPKQRRALIYPFVFLGWFTTGYMAFATALFGHYIMTAVLMACLALLVFLFLNRLRAERVSKS